MAPVEVELGVGVPRPGNGLGAGGNATLPVFSVLSHVLSAPRAS